MSDLVLLVNGKQQRVNAPPDEPLLSVLRNRLELTGSKYGCGEGRCGACTVLMDGTPVRSCRTPVSQGAGKKITTLEGLSRMAASTPCSRRSSLKRRCSAATAP